MRSNLRFMQDLFEEERQYWRKQLEGTVPAASFPADFKDTGETTERGVLERRLGTGSCRLLAKACRGNELLLFTALTAALKICLRRYSGEEDIVVGGGIYNRFSEAEILNDRLALRDRVRGETSSRELLEQVKKTIREAYRNQKCPYEQVKSVSGATAPGEELTRVVIGLESINEREGVLGLDSDVTFLFSRSEEAGGDQQVSLRVEYRLSAYRKETIERYVDQYEMVLYSMLQAPDLPIYSIPLVGAEERSLLVNDLNDTRRIYRKELCVHQLFEAQAVLSADDPAVVYAGEQLTYAELNRRANRLAHYLRKLGAGADVIVGIRLDRGIEMAVSVLAALKAGAAYLPLDSVYPRELLSYMVEDANARIIVTEKRFSDEWSNSGAQVVTLDGESEAIELESPENPVCDSQPDNLAYVIYTSGSTGKPKGVAMPHKPLVNLLEWHRTTLSSRSRTLQFALLSFDASFHEIFSTWSSGGTLYIVSDVMRLDTVGLGHLLVSEGIHKLTLPVVVLQQMAEEFCDRAELLTSLQEVVTTGEQLLVTPPISKLFTALGCASLHNHYGPSETHVVTSFKFPKEVEQWPAYPPIGRPISNTAAYILDEYFNPMPFGVTGELYISGDSLARCYLGRPSLTAEKFLPDPFSLEPGARLYRTGDLARYLDSGDIEFLGRLDYQVKIRGFRVELGEIEAVLAEHHRVREGIVLARKSEPGDIRLVGYVALEEETAVSEQQLQSHLRQKLPHHMVPSRIVIVDEMPLTANGKIDRNRLPEPDWQRPAIEDAFVPPTTAAEIVVAGIWSRVLGLKQIGIVDNFFRLGGHSMLATRLVFRVREAFGIDVPLRVLFAAPTIEGLIAGMGEIWGSSKLVEEVAAALLEVEQLSEDELVGLLS